LGHRHLRTVPVRVASISGLFADGGEVPDVPVLASVLAVVSLAGLVMAFSGFFLDAPGSSRGPLADRIATWLLRLLAAAAVLALVVAGLALSHTDWSHRTTTATDDPSEQAVTYGLFVGVIIAAWALRSLRRRPLQAGAATQVG